MIKNLLTKFSTELKNLKKRQQNNGKTTQDILHLINEFGNLHNLKEEVRVHFVDDQLQKTETDTCRVF